MKAIAVRRGDSRPTVVERPPPEPGPDEALIRTLAVGVDGTDYEVLRGDHGGFPPGEDHLVLGHEAVGVVERPPAEGAVGGSGGAGERYAGAGELREGDVVVPTVRRPLADGAENDPAEGTTDYFARGDQDMAPPDAVAECGIDGAHGFMAERFACPAEHLVRIPEHLADVGFLVEPMSITEKAMDLARASRSTFDWRPESAIVLGNGSLGLLTLASLADRGFERTYCLGRRDRPDPTIALVEDLGATYVDSRETPVPEIPDTHEPMDLVYEATGYAPHAVESVSALAPNGVAALLGLPGEWTAEVDVGRFHAEMVLGNRAVVGSVNAARRHFEAAVESLAAIPEWVTDRLVTGVYPMAEFERAFPGLDDGGDAGDGVSGESEGETPIKTAVQISQL